MKSSSRKTKKLKLSSCTPREDAERAVKDAAAFADAQALKKKPKVSTYDPQPHCSSESSGSSATLQSTRMKATGNGGFKVSNSRKRSVAAVPNVQPNDPRTTEEILDEWFSGATKHGWDEGYVNSFVVKDLEPPTSDPDVPPQISQTGKGDVVLLEWSKKLDMYLRIIITLEGRGSDPPLLCQGGLSHGQNECLGEACYRCTTCHNGGLLCGDCMRERHCNTPLHRVEKWNGEYFERTLLKSLGLRVQLGHPPGQPCPIPERTRNDDFVIIDCDMIHSVGLDYCACGYTGKSQIEQLLERRLYPATILNPRTAATFRCLEVFELLQYEAKLTPYEFFNTLSRLTDNTGLKILKDRYPSLLRMIHQWRHMRLMKRSGKGHDPGGVESTAQGECALLCPHCPHPGINMPEGWENEPEQTRFIHALNIGIDANYRLKRKDVSSEEADPGLSKGFAYFVKTEPFLEFLDTHKDDKEPKSTCSRHDAVNLADVHLGQGYASSGVATIECTRHNMKRPSAVCDLQKGERYCNIDYAYIASLIVFGLTCLRTFLISYDIVCQWSKRLFARVQEINREMGALHSESDIRFVVPKFHLPAHIPSCQTRFAYMFTPGAGLGDGEAPERGWAETNPLGPSTREMGPGSRRDTLDSHFGDYNWGKYIIAALTLLKKMDIATSGVAERIISHQEFERGLNVVDVKQWEELVAKWERDPNSVPNPFDLTITAPSQSAIRKEFSDEDAKALALGKSFSLTNDISPNQLICRGIDLESEMRSLKENMKQQWDHSRDRELTKLQLKSNAVVKKVDAWYNILRLHIPSISFLQERHADSSKSVKPYDLPLWLPSQIGRQVPVPGDLLEIEFKIRLAQAQDALSNIRRNLQRRVTVWDLKDRWLRGQSANTRALNTLSTLQQKIRSAKAEYTQARKALLDLAALLGKKDVEKVFRVLEDKDLKPLQSESAITAPSAGQTRETGKSWIWNHPGASMDNLTEYDAQIKKVEWAKSRARALRYQEEILIVKEEMNRTLRFFRWKEDRWRERGMSKTLDVSEGGEPLTPEHEEGLRAYAARQASIFRGLHDLCISQWLHVDRMIEMSKMEVRDPKLLFARLERERARLMSKPLTRAGLSATTRGGQNIA